jgi:protein transport protein SEC24
LYDAGTVFTGYGAVSTIRLILTASSLNTHLIYFASGLRISAHYGNFHQRSPTDLEFGTLDADKAISIALEHSSRSLDNERQEYAYLQCAVLYTTVKGERRVRTINLALQVAALAGNVFRFADMDAAVCHFAREGE